MRRAAVGVAAVLALVAPAVASATSTRVVGNGFVSKYERFVSSCEKSASARGEVYELESGATCDSCDAITFARSLGSFEMSLSARATEAR